MPLILVAPYRVTQPSYLFDFVAKDEAPMQLNMRAVPSAQELFIQSVAPGKLYMKSIAETTGIITAASINMPMVMQARMPADTGAVVIQGSTQLQVNSKQAQASAVFVQGSTALTMRAKSPR